ncbi:hypothetical protein L3Y34_006194 [Caenorhabditis briggsae]|uniref:T20D4.11-like domain-containing protein n=1 Tax=Caenorhabditis briggsae TaxID=6238 RepID=A0AAE9CZ30_CAEBR|nr:hypothetical protein L3Y34_006194 [Caenorhabditis briggsae]
MKEEDDQKLVCYPTDLRPLHNTYKTCLTIYPLTFNMISLILLFLGIVSGSIENSCTPVEGPKALKCYHKLVDLTDNAVALDFNQNENTKIINKLCEDFKHPCAIPLKCGAEKEVVNSCR